MTTTEILQYILLPCIGYLLFNSARNGARLTRIETALRILIRKYPRENDDE